MTGSPPGFPRAVVFDLFGTLVDAPTREDRAHAAARISAVAQVPPAVAERVLADSWAERHDGRLPTTEALGAHLWERCGRTGPVPAELPALLARLAAPRLAADPAVLSVIDGLRRGGTRIGVLSDASADIADAWPRTALAGLADTAVFSCRAGAVKPAAALYAAVLTDLGAEPAAALFCGDGGGDELRGAEAAGMRAVRVERRGGAGTMAFGERPWPGPSLQGVEQLPAFLAGRTGGTR